MSGTIRVAIIADIAAMKRIRDSVRENALVSGTIEHADYVQAITVDGRAWVYVEDGVVVGFVCGRLTQRDVWALFVSESHERRGIGNERDRIVACAAVFDAHASDIFRSADGLRFPQSLLRLPHPGV